MTKYIPIESLYSALNFIEQSAVKGEEKNVKCITKAIRSIKFVSEDVVKVVRCKDCYYRYVLNRGESSICNLLDAQNNGEAYCSYGERKDG